MNDTQRRSREWRMSDDGFESRVGSYLSAMLFADERLRRTEFSTLKAAPDWPAVGYYDPATDQPFWVEVKYRMAARDYRRSMRLGGGIGMNEAAIALADSEPK